MWFILYKLYIKDGLCGYTHVEGSNFTPPYKGAMEDELGHSMKDYLMHLMATNYVNKDSSLVSAAENKNRDTQ